MALRGSFSPSLIFHPSFLHPLLYLSALHHQSFLHLLPFNPSLTPSARSSRVSSSWTTVTTCAAMSGPWVSPRWSLLTASPHCPTSIPCELSSRWVTGDREGRREGGTYTTSMGKSNNRIQNQEVSHEGFRKGVTKEGGTGDSR